MVKHIILWTLKKESNTESVKTQMKAALENLVNEIPGLLKLHVEINPLPTSNADVMLYSEFDSEEALKEYAVHPEHVKVADTKVRPFTETRTVMDFVEKRL